MIMRAEDIGRIATLSMFGTAAARCSIAAEPMPSSRLLPTWQGIPGRLGDLGDLDRPRRSRHSSPDRC